MHSGNSRKARHRLWRPLRLWLGYRQGLTCGPRTPPSARGRASCLSPRSHPLHSERVRPPRVLAWRKASRGLASPSASRCGSPLWVPVLGRRAEARAEACPRSSPRSGSTSTSQVIFTQLPRHTIFWRQCSTTHLLQQPAADRSATGRLATGAGHE